MSEHYFLVNDKEKTKTRIAAGLHPLVSRLWVDTSFNGIFAFLQDNLNVNIRVVSEEHADIDDYYEYEEKKC